MRTRWPRCWDPTEKVDLLDGVEELSSEDEGDEEAQSGGELWRMVLAFGDAPAACALGATASAMHNAVVRSSAGEFLFYFISRRLFPCDNPLLTI